MDFSFSEEQELLRGATRSWLAVHYPTARVAELADSEAGWDPTSWRQLSGLGWLDPDLSTLDHAVLAEEAGYALYPGPWWVTVALAAPLLGGPPEQPTTLAWAEEGSPLIPGPPRGTAVRSVGGELRVTGRKLRVPDVSSCARLLVGADSCIVEVDPAAVDVQPLSTMDTTRRLSTVVLDDVPAQLVLDGPAAAEALIAVRRTALVLLACEAVGIAARALELSSSYAKDRKQFGRPIGAFQGVSHRIADIYTGLQLARSLAYRAAWAVETDDDGVDQAIAAAAVCAGSGAVGACELAIQAMGGIGFTWDHPLHRFYKRAQAIESFDRGPAGHRADLAAILLD